MPDAADRLNAALAGRYAIARELGAGGMATVYLAEDLRHHRRVAIKVLRPELAAAIGPERFVREIETTANLRHPHILPLYDSGEAGGFLFYVMPYVEGESLRDRLDREKQLPLDDALLVAREVADALSYAHSRGVVHRDIKPENILLESGHAVVADFGIARAVDAAGGDRLTQTGIAVGTPAYMSPEQGAGSRELDGRSDLYALGCVLYEMLAGQPPFTGPTIESVVHQHLTAEPRAITQIRPAVPAEIAGVLQRALAKNPADRFNPVAQFSDALGRRTAGVPVVVERWPRRWLLGAAMLVGVAVLAGALVLRTGWRSERTPVVGRTVQVTREPGLEVDPALSPDGQLVAYAAGPATRMQIVVRQSSGGRTVALTGDSGANYRWPRWSPDGSRIAYQAADGIYVVPALGGAPRLVARGPESLGRTSGGSVAPLAGLAWSPDGRRIAFAGYFGAPRLHVVDADGGEVTMLAAPREPHSPAWSPDGTRIAVASGNAAFVFGMTYFGNAGWSSIWIVPVDGRPPVRVTEGTSLDASPQWSPDGRFLYFVSDRGGSLDVYRVRVDRRGAPVGAPVRVTTGLEAQTITLSPDGTRLAYARLRSSSNIWSIPVPRAGTVSAAAALPVTSGDQTIEQVDVSADGRWLAFDSDRSGNADIYKQPVSGAEAIQLTTDSAGDFSPVWSPDGGRIAFHSLRNDNRDLFTMNADGTGLVQRSSSPRHELDPGWAPDGNAIVAEVIDTGAAGEWSFVIVPVNGAAGGVRDVPAKGDFAEWSPTGDLIAYHAADGMRVISPDGGPTRLVASNAADGTEAFYAAWSPDGTVLYYLARGDAGWMIRAVPRGGGASRVLVRFDDPARQPAGYGFATDGRTFYFTVGSHESDVWVMELGRP